MMEITDNCSMAHHFDEPLDGFVVTVASVVFGVLWSFELVFVSFLIVDNLVLKISKKIRPMLQIPLMFCCRAHFVHTFACRFRHIIDWFVCLMKNIVGAFANCICNLFDLKTRDTEKLANFVQKRSVWNFSPLYLSLRWPILSPDDLYLHLS